MTGVFCMPLSQKIETIMVSVDNLPIIYNDYLVAQAVAVLRQFSHRQDGTWYGFQAALVTEPTGHLVGLLTLRGLLRAFKIRAIQEHLLTSDAEVFFLPAGGNDNLDILVQDIMRPIGLVTVSSKDNVFEAVRKMVKHKINLLPVVDDGHLVGMVRTIDVFWIVGELI